MELFMNFFVIMGIAELIVSVMITIIGSIYLYKKHSKQILNAGYVLTIISVFFAIGLTGKLPEFIVFGGVISLLISCLSTIPILKENHLPVKNIVLSAIIASILFLYVNLIYANKADDLWALAITFIAVWGLPFSFCLGIIANFWLIRGPKFSKNLLVFIPFVNALIVNAIFLGIMFAIT